ncbi:carbohydrate-binding module family 48 protein [Bipolaris maydis ATCC 48331]|uniref:Carbohydrate-binding module family 48 protein n=2 Tax=Cochliobolus heterostrophus TaxID=5016 RepID=M2UEK7_COCH5|nr:carbohydrate-binding module family 48 protein [Bipolaris maydis ATCC 48331]EMD86418.1 carbohydrate-binding module family 48 protein [Bipolaris maydis C5]KAJ6214035.1 carbohydrate-binding module family 48 protein [Bipolaris maydis]ENI06369.1 carbohydrate-binding module family 48 protein [Bipolaris maydis ATCC 48331]KAJ6275236.1 carbohydrate-binding module family 48 protein [Bipolaris maydis]KAJ6285474.1 carbohydrate-binding module family 48 protein [Bipolaris maydis]
MGKYTFTWEHAANDVYVTGTFDDWRKTVKLELEDGVFKKTVELPKLHTQYKFVVNGNWCTNETARTEDDGHGIINNVLYPEDIVDEEPVTTLSSVAPESTTAALAGAVPKESDKAATDGAALPGTFPETPFAETPAGEAQTFNVSPIPASSTNGNPIKLAPGEPVPDPSTLTNNTVESTVKHDEEPEQEPATFGVAPIPATAGLGNPIHLAPGEPVPDPSTLTSNTVESTVKTDPASYEKADALPPLAFTPQAERDAKGGMFGIPPITGNMIPESSLPMGGDAKTEQDTGVTVQSVAPTSTTVELAGQVPKEPRGVPETVTESQQQAHAEPEASANAEAVQEKKEVEQELKETVPEAPVTSQDPTLGDHAQTAVATAAAGATAGAGLFAAAVYTAKDKIAETTGLNGPSTTTADEVPSVVAESQNTAHAEPEAAASPEAVADKSAVEQELLSEVPKTTEAGEPAPAIAVPAVVVADSQHEAHASPEAAANSEAVTEKAAVESELLSKLPKAEEAGEPAPVITAATTATAPGANTEAVASEVPTVVAESQKEAHASPEAASNAEAVSEEKAVENELPQEVKPAHANGEPTPSSATVDSKPVESSTEPQTATETETAKPVESRPIDSTTDVAFAPKEATSTEQTQPAAAGASEEAKPDAETSAPSGQLAPEAPAKSPRKDSDVSPKGTPGSQSIVSAADDKKKKRRSFFGKLKDKLVGKDKN